MHNGVPFDAAFSADDTTRAAFAIVFSEFGGAKFNWNTMAYEDQK